MLLYLPARLRPLFLLGAVIMGAGRGLYLTPARALLSEVFVSRRGQAFGDPYGIERSEWDSVGGARCRCPRGSDVASSVSPDSGFAWPSRPHTGGGRSRVSRYRPACRAATPFRRLLFAYSLYLFVIQGVLGFLPTFLQATHRLSTVTETTAFALLFVIGLGAKPMAGNLSDWIPRPLVGTSALLVGVVGMVLFVSASTLPTIFGGVFAIEYTSFGSVMQADLMDTFLEISIGGDLGPIRAVYLPRGSIGLIYVGVVASKWSYLVAFASFGVFFLVGTVLVFSIHCSSRDH